MEIRRVHLHRERPGAEWWTSSGIKSVTINDVEQTVGSTYSLPAPDGGNNDAGNEYTVVATDNAGNQTTATVTVYRRHRVQVISPDRSKTYVDKLLAHNEYLILTMKLPEDAAVKLTDEADGTEIPYDKEKKQFVVGLINRSRTLLLEYSTVYPQVGSSWGRASALRDTARIRTKRTISRLHARIRTITAIRWP